MSLLKAAEGSRKRHGKARAKCVTLATAPQPIDPRLPVHRTQGWLHQQLIKQSVAYEAWLHA